jgi:hypothetical protein
MEKNKDLDCIPRRIFNMKGILNWTILMAKEFLLIKMNMYNLKVHLKRVSLLMERFILARLYTRVKSRTTLFREKEFSYSKTTFN